MQDVKDLQDRKKVRAGETTTKKATSKKATRTRTKGGSTRKIEASPPALPTISSQTAIYNQVAREYDVEPETVKRLFEQDDS